jgi:ABC-2 type transport system ATP-binding protein
MDGTQRMLEIVDLSKTYPNGVCALDHVSLTVPRGMFGLLGPNGAGKSTLMRTIATLQEADAGSITLTGREGRIDVLAEKSRLRRVLGYLPQEFGVYPRTSPAVMLDHLAVLKGIARRAERRELVERLLRQTNLWEVRRKNLDTFSGGMKQRFGIAQALIGDPQLVIVDEPTAGLDPAERRRFHNLLARIGEDVVVILSTHIVEDVYELCPAMAIMAGGRILAQGAPAALMAELDGRLWGLVVDTDAVADYHTRFPVVSTRMVAGRTELRIIGEQRPAPDMQPLQPTLEDVYFATLEKHGFDLAIA